MCVARGNPIPLINWDNEILSNGPNITIRGDRLELGNNIFNCNASSRNGFDIKSITIILVSDEVDVDSIKLTQQLVNNQTSLNEEETKNLSSFIRTSVQSVDNSRMSNSTSSTNATTNANSTTQVFGAVSDLYSDVIRLSGREISRETTSDLFETGGQLVRTSQNEQGVAQDREIQIPSGVRKYNIVYVYSLIT